MVSGPAGDGGDVTLDLAELVECDQAGVDSLTVLARTGARGGGRLVFCSAREEIQVALEQGNLETQTSP